MINRVITQLNNEIPRQLAELQQEQRALKNKQFLGGENLTSDSSSEGSFSTLLSPGVANSQSLGINLYGTRKVLYQSELKLAFFITNDANPDYAWPYGLHVNTGDFRRGVHYDLAYSDEFGNGNKTYFVTMENTTAAAYMLYVHFSVVYGTSNVGAIA